MSHPQPNILAAISLAAAALLPATALADNHAMDGADNHAWHCQHGSLERHVAVVYETDQPVPCAVRYSKPTEGKGDSFPWSARHQAGYCEAHAADLVGKLQGWGWQCSAADS